MVKKFDDIEIENPLYDPADFEIEYIENPDIARIVLSLSADVSKFCKGWIDSRNLVKEFGGRDTADIIINAMGHTVGVMVKEYSEAFNVHHNEVIKVVSTQLAHGLKN